MKPENIFQLVNTFGTPLYVYEEEIVRHNYHSITNTFPEAEIYYAVMCNNNPFILRIIQEMGGGVQINSLSELDLASNAGFSRDKIYFTSVGLDPKTLETLVTEKISLNLDSVEEVEKYCRIGNDLGIRVRMPEFKLPRQTTNSSKNSNVGIVEQYFDRIKSLAAASGSRVIGFHGYLASNINEPEPFAQFADYLSQQARKFPDLQYVNFGSGFGLELDLSVVSGYYGTVMRELSTFFGRQIRMKIEPGRSIMALAGKLYTKVTNVKQLDGKKQIAIDAGFGDFVRPLLYGAEHPIEVVGKSGTKEWYDIRGNTVLQSDFLGYNRKLPPVKEDDILMISNVGAYGRVMASGFPGKTLPKEVVVMMDGSL